MECERLVLEVLVVGFMVSIGQRHAESFYAQAGEVTGASLPQFVKDEFDAFLKRGILAHGFLRLRCADCGHDKPVAFSCKRGAFYPSCGARRMAQTAAHLVAHVMPRKPVFGAAAGTEGDV